MFSEFLKFVKTDNLKGSFIDFYKEIQNEEHLELNLTIHGVILGSTKVDGKMKKCSTSLF